MFTDLGKPKYSETCPSATLSNSDLTRTDLGSNPGLHGKMTATGLQNHDRGVKDENNLNYI